MVINLYLKDYNNLGFQVPTKNLILNGHFKKKGVITFLDRLAINGTPSKKKKQLHIILFDNLNTKKHL